MPTQWWKCCFRNLKVEEEKEAERWNKLHILIVMGYFSNLHMTCNFPRLPSLHSFITDYQWSNPQIVASFKQQLKKMFLVPRLNKFHQTQNRISKSHLLQAFLSFLLQLLYHITPPIVDPFQDGIGILEKELRYLLTILGDISWMLPDAEFQNLLTEFEALANEAGSLIYYLFFSADRAVEKTSEGLAAVLKHADLLKANLESFVSLPAAYTTPTTSIVDSILILGSVVEDVEDLLNREDDPMPELKDQVKLLHLELLLSRSLIKDMRSRPQLKETEQVKEALTRMGGIAHQVEYLITSFWVKDAPLWYIVSRLTHLTHMIESVKTELQPITLKYKSEGLKVAEELPLQDRKNTEVNNLIVGFEDKTMVILDQLVGGAIQCLQIISILGMAGLGKTTLANKLYNHPLVSYRFDKLSWCVVSQTYKRQSILANILIHINSEFEKNSVLEMEVITLVEHIHKTLKGRRFLLVLDDIWDSDVLDELLSCFPDDGNGSRILFTSRNKDVTPPNSIVHELPLLMDEQCWELLQKKVFGSRACPPQLQRIGKKIAARCCGLPLVVVVIAGILSSVHEEGRTWEEVAGSLGSYINGEDHSVMQILELSYDHLPDHLKPCFLYFGEFKEDEEISVGRLKRLWVSEGFTRKEKDMNAENIAEEYLMELIDKSLVMIAKRKSNGRGVKACVIHDLLRDLCLRISKEESFLKYLNDYHIIYEKGHRLRAVGETVSLSYCQHVRSFVGDHLDSTFYVGDMRLLRVLHFNSSHSFEKGLTPGIEYLVNLRFLVINTLPTWIDILVNLEYVRIGQRETYLPPAIMKMKKLRYICASYVEYSEDWNISNQTNNLQYLSEVCIKELKDEELLKCSTHLRKLKCHYYPGNKRVCPHFDLSFLAQLDSLSLSGILWTGDFRFPSNITKLTLGMSSLPWEMMSIVGTLQNLEVLKLREGAFEGRRWDTRDGEFQKLRFLQLDYLYDLSEWNVDSNEHFPKLQRLVLINCWNLQEIPSEIGEITTLELIEVKGGFQKSVVESAERIIEDQRDMGNEDLELIINRHEGLRMF